MKLSALILAALSALAISTTTLQACERHEASACGEGQVWDSATHACVPKVGS